MTADFKGISKLLLFSVSAQD